MDERKRSGEFRRIKHQAFRSETINRNGTGFMQLSVIRIGRNHKEGAYYSLLAKKFLWNNYDPSKARFNMKKAITLNAFDIKDYCCFLFHTCRKNDKKSLFNICFCHDDQSSYDSTLHIVHRHPAGIRFRHCKPPGYWRGREFPWILSLPAKPLIMVITICCIFSILPGRLIFYTIYGKQIFRLSCRRS